VRRRLATHDRKSVRVLSNRLLYQSRRNRAVVARQAICANYQSPCCDKCQLLTQVFKPPPPVSSRLESSYIVHLLHTCTVSNCVSSRWSRRSESFLVDSLSIFEASGRPNPLAEGSISPTLHFSR
jgi:hypothetical protein